jgi:hypothetical protein
LSESGHLGRQRLLQFGLDDGRQISFADKKFPEGFREESTIGSGQQKDKR